MTHTCACGFEAASMGAFVDHVSDEHDAFDIAVNALLAERPSTAGPEVTP